MIKSKFISGIEQGHNVFRWDANLGVVDVVEYVAAAGLESFEICFYVVFNSIRPGKR